MQVSKVTPYLVDSGGSKSWLFVKLETDDGLVGWGEAYTQADRDRLSREKAQAESEKTELRAQLLSQFNAVLQTRDSARGWRGAGRAGRRDVSRLSRHRRHARGLVRASGRPRLDSVSAAGWG